MDTNKLQAALEETRYGLLEVEEQYEALGVRKGRLEALVASIESVMASEGSQLVALPEAVSATSLEEEDASNGDFAFPSMPLWRVAKDILSTVAHPMTVPEITERLVQRGVHVQGDGIRVAMIRRTDIFDKIGYGKYALREWRPVDATRPDFYELAAEQEDLAQ